MSTDAGFAALQAQIAALAPIPVAERNDYRRISNRAIAFDVLLLPLYDGARALPGADLWPDGFNKMALAATTSGATNALLTFYGCPTAGILQVRRLRVLSSLCGPGA